MMKSKIEEVERYFRDKLLAGDFDIRKIEEFLVYLTIDSLYDFCIWIGNWHIPELRSLYDDSYMRFNLTDTDAKKLHNVLKKDVEQNLKKIVLRDKLKEIEKLKKDLKL